MEIALTVTLSTIVWYASGRRLVIITPDSLGRCAAENMDPL